LSGGHDSSSVASIAGWLQQRSNDVNVRGTVTFVDSIGEGDERQFATAVLKKYPLESITIADPCPWDSDGAPPPLTPMPSRDYPFWKRDRFLSAELRRRRCDALLSGIGPDYYLPLTCAHALDLARQARVADAAEVFTDWTIQNRSNFWREGYRELLTPLLPVAIQRRLLRAPAERPAWLREEFLTDREFRALQVERDVIRGWAGAVCTERVAKRFTEIPGGLQGWRHLEVSLRHPLLHLPLVQFCLSLDWRHRTSFSQPKPILRRAMAGIVPDVILDRHTKGSLVLPRVVWAFRHHRGRLRLLLKNPILGDLGVIEPARVEQAIDDAAAGRISARHLYFALSLETWLSARAKRPELMAA
ncbi:MAG TPA: asparagine synthase-related protein, partial [Vicinamibacterales bacterium]|nr:asparagine synthase-related protein [Vicinamibacterales bacterium]